MNTPRRSPTSRPLLAGLLVALCLVLAPVTAGTAGTSPGVADAAAGRAVPPHLHAAPVRTRSVPPARHVFVINIENKGYDRTWGPDSQAPYLSRVLRAKGVLLDHYYGTAHVSQSNYVAQISGQGPNPQMQSDCQYFTDFHQIGTVAPGQAVGTGCVFPRSVGSLPIQMTRAHLSWRGYMGDMDGACEHPVVDQQDHTQSASAQHMYATRHDPFVYFHAIIDKPAYCREHVVPLTRLRDDLRDRRRTPRLVYITPDLCDDGHDAPCADGRPGGLRSVDVFMKRWVPRILASRAFKKDGVLIVTADESDGPQTDSTACCGETAVNTPQAGIAGSGGGRIGSLVISRWTRPGTWSTTPYNHYSLLGSMERIFGLPKLGYARAQGLDTFGLDVYNSGWNERRG